MAIVTGAGRGLGRAMAEALARAGADLMLVGRDGARLGETRAAVAAGGRRAEVCVADLAERSAAGRIVRAAIGAFGKVDILVNNAGIIRRRPAFDFTEEDWDEVMAVNLDSVFFLSQACARDMRARRWGKIINIASLLTFSGGITVPSYAASKGGVGQITKALANEWAREGICVNAIAPGYMETDNTRALRQDPQRNTEISARIPAGRWGVPGDLAGPVVFLASDASAYVHGHILLVDGGWMAR